MNNFTIARKIILDKRRPFTGRRASDASGGFFQCLLRGLPAAYPSRAYASPGFAVESKRLFAVSCERSEMVFDTKKIQHATGRTPFAGGGAGDAGDRVFGAS